MAVTYVRGKFIIDVVSTLPWSIIHKKWVFLRFLKINRLGQYQGYLDEMIHDSLINYLNNEQVKKIINAIRMMISLLLSSHFFANIWVLIGMQKYEIKAGWIWANEQDAIQNTDFISLYISSFYWVITSFSSVGYGDIKGNT